MICAEESSLDTNTKMRSIWILEVILLLSFVELETTSASQFRCRKRKLTVTANGYLKLYFDGIEIHQNRLLNFDKWQTPDVVDLPCTTKLIAIHGRNGAQEAGILASTDDGYLLTNSSWKCSNVERFGWKETDFDDSAWLSAMEYGHNGDTGMTIVPSISSNAAWIWLRKDISSHVVMDWSVGLCCRRRLEINKCESSPCLHGGSCFSTINDYVCVCRPEWTGVRCRIPVNACDLNPCLNGGTCKTHGDESFTCTCPTYATGLKCEKLINYCDSSPCSNGGSCKSTVNGYVCQCQPGYIGDNCEYAINTCGSNPCLSGGSCLNTVNGYICQCPPRYTGNRCQDARTVINYCESGPCLNGGSCESTENRYVCRCSPGFTDYRCQNAVVTEDDSTSWRISDVFIGVSVLASIALLYALCAFCSRKKRAEDEVKDEGGNNQIHQNDRVDPSVRRRIVQN